MAPLVVRKRQVGEVLEIMARRIVIVALCLVLCKLFSTVQADDFPSLLTANASLAIILDREFLDTLKGEFHDRLLTDVKVIIEKILREDLRNGGLYVTYYSWSNVNLKRDYMAVFSVTNCKQTWEVFDKAREESLLHMALTEADCPRLPSTEAIMIPIISVGEELPQIVYDVKTTALKWKSAIILHDESFARDTISRVAIAATNESPHGYIPAMSASLFKLKAHVQEWERRKSLRRILSKLPTEFIGTNFLVIVNRILLETVMETAKDLGMVNTDSRWLYIISDTDEKSDNLTALAELIGEGENVAFIYNSTINSPTCVFGYSCHAHEMLRSFVLALSRIIREETAIYGQISDEEWETIRPSKPERIQTFLKIINTNLKTTSVCGNCSRWMVQAAEYWGSSYEATDDKSIGNNVVQEDWSMIKLSRAKSTPKMVAVGVWNSLNGVELFDVLFPHVSFGFRNKNMHIVTYHNPPWQIIKYNDSGMPGELKGVVVDILNELSRKLNFTYTMHIIPVTYLKTVNETEMQIYNGTEELQLPTLNIPSEILNVVGQNKVLFAAVGATISEKYTRLINFTIPISVQPYNFIVSRPRELSRLFLFMSPFTTDTWFCLAACIIFMGPFLYTINRLSPYYDYKGVDFNRTGLHKMSNCFWYIYGALLQQGGMYLPLADSGRIIVGTWWLVVIVLVTTYCGNLVAFLTFPKIDIPISNLNELAKRTDVTWSFRSDSFLEDYMKNTDEPKYMRLLEGGELVSQVTADVVERVRTGKHIYIDWKSNLQYIMKKAYVENDRCDFSLGMDDFIDERIGIVMPENSPYLNLINKEIERMHQMGFIERWLKEYLPKRDRCWNIGKLVEVSNHTVNLDDMQGSFLVLLIGCAAGLFLIIVECGWARHRRNKEAKIIKPFVK